MLKLVTHPEEEDTPYKHDNDWNEANAIRYPPDIAKLLCVVRSLCFTKGCQKDNKHHGVEPVTPSLQYIEHKP